MSARPAAAKLPHTLAARLALGDELRVSATFEEYLEFAETCEYRVEYSNGQIISHMGTPTDTHELIVGNVIWALGNLVGDHDNFKIYGSNLGLLVGLSGVHYKPDVVVLDDEPQFLFHKVKKQTLRSVVNPFAVFEVFSDGTMGYDMGEKLPNYKQCPSLRHIVFVHQHKPFVTVFARSDRPDTWLNRDFAGLDAHFELGSWQTPLKNVYRKVVFMGHNPPHPAK